MPTMCGVHSSVLTNSVNELPSKFDKQSIFYYNVRSILPKLDNLAAACLVSTPDIVCFVAAAFKLSTLAIRVRI